MAHGVSTVTRLLRAGIVVFLLAIFLPVLAQAQSELGRKVIHMPGYHATPGDVYSLVIDFGINGATGSSNVTTYPVIVQEDNTIEIPYIGTINVGDSTFLQLQKLVVSKIKAAIPVQYVSFSLQAPAIFDVFVYGTVTKPGQTQMTSLNRLTDVLAAAGGLSAPSSTRRVQLIRAGATTTYDLTDYFIKGNEAANPYLRPGDEVHVPRIAQAVEISGAVTRPGTYEVLPGDTLGDILKMAGGLLPMATEDQATVERLNAENRYVQTAIGSNQLDKYGMKNGDRISIPSSIPSVDRVTLEGAVYGKPLGNNEVQAVPDKPVRFDIPYRPGMTLLDVLDMMGGPTPFAETQRSYIIKSTTGQRMPIPDLADLWKTRNPARNVVIDRGDYIVIPMVSLNIMVGGEVNAPQRLPYVSGYTVGDYVLAAGGVNIQTGDSNAVYFVSTTGQREKVGLGTPVPPGTVIYVAKNTFTNMQTFFSNLFIVTGWVTTIIGVTITVADFVNRVK
ncbi:MAG TPA: SLBB domain-containing protein [Spirochaetia bacterium]|nr:SLBB domain-containing protein [Spirochaetia bacterium]